MVTLTKDGEVFGRSIVERSSGRVVADMVAIDQAAKEAGQAHDDTLGQGLGVQAGLTSSTEILRSVIR